jgi:hypothetical protein
MDLRARKFPADLVLAPTPHARGAFGRRELVRSLVAGAFLSGSSALGCRGSGTERPSSSALPSSRLSRASLWSWFDLPDEARSRELSGLAWEEGARTLWAVQDNSGSIVSLLPDREARAWAFGDVVHVDLPGRLDLEGIACTHDGFVLCSETGPRIFEVDRKGRFRHEVFLPAYVAEAVRNKSLESLALSPSQRYLFTTSEIALPRDGAAATRSAGTRLRLLRLDRAAATWAEHAYATDAAPQETGDYGVADVTALSDDEVLILERGFSRGTGNTARIYHVSLQDRRAMCSGVERLTPDAPVLDKHLVVDLASLRRNGLPAPRAPQPHPVLDNYEGLAVGPRLPDGNRSLLLVSDDNGRPEQIARVLVLTLGG